MSPVGCSPTPAQDLQTETPSIRLAVKNAIAGLAGDTANMGSRITSQSQMGGWPVLAEKRRALQVPANPHKVAPGESFRTNVEVWLETFARDLEGPRQSSER